MDGQQAVVPVLGKEVDVMRSCRVINTDGLGDGAEIRTPMAVAVICGLLTSTFLTLLVIPTIYYLFGLAGERLFKVKEE